MVSLANFYTVVPGGHRLLFQGCQECFLIIIIIILSFLYKFLYTLRELFYINSSTSYVNSLEPAASDLSCTDCFCPFVGEARMGML